MWSRIHSFIEKHEAIIIILCLVTLLRIPSLFEPYWYGDEGIYLTLGQGVRHGLQLYRDIHDNKPPIIYLLAAIAGTQFWFRFLLLTWNLATLVVFWNLARAWIGRQTDGMAVRLRQLELPNLISPVALATLFFALVQFAIEGNIANGEIFFVLPTTLGVLFLTKTVSKTASLKKKILLTIAAGLSFSFAFLIKVPAAFDAFAAGLFFFIIFPFHKQRAIEYIKQIPWIRAILFTVCFLLPVLLSVGYYFSIGAGQQYVVGAFAQNIGYLSSWKTGSFQATSAGQSGLKNRGLLLLVGIVLVFAGSLVISPALVLTLLWFFAALFGALLSERPYPHYLIQILPAASLLFGIGIASLQSGMKRFQLSLPRIITSAFFVLPWAVLIASIVMIKFWAYPISTYYANFFFFVTKRETKQQYYASFDPAVNDLYSMAEYIASHTTKDDRIFVWGDLPTIYALTQRLPPGRYTSAYHIQDFNGYEETATAIEKQQPKFIVVDTTTGYRFPALQTIITFDYHFVNTIGRLQLYQRQSMNITIR